MTVTLIITGSPKKDEVLDEGTSISALMTKMDRDPTKFSYEIMSKVGEKEVDVDPYRVLNDGDILLATKRSTGG